MWIFCGVAVVDYMFFGTNLGNISADLKFDEDLSYFSDSLFINKLLISKNKYAIVNNCSLSIYDNVDFDDKEYILSFMSFTERLNDSLGKNSDSIPDYIQYLFVYFLKDLIHQWLCEIFPGVPKEQERV